MQKPAGVPSIKDQLGHLRDQLCSEIDHTESSERSRTLPVRSESFFSLSLELQWSLLMHFMHQSRDAVVRIISYPFGTHALAYASTGA